MSKDKPSPSNIAAPTAIPERLSAAAAELVRLPVDLITTYGTPASRAAKAATSTIPIVMISVGDPVRAGLVQSLARPGGNVTGNTILSPDLGPKRLQLVKEIIPSASRVALLWNPDNVSKRGDPRADARRGAGPGPCVHRRRGAQRRRFRRRVRHLGARAARCGAAHQRSDPPEPTSSRSSPSCRRTAAGNVPDPGQRRGRRPDVLRRESSGAVPPGRLLRRRRSCRAPSRPTCRCRRRSDSSW